MNEREDRGLAHGRHCTGSTVARPLGRFASPDPPALASPTAAARRTLTYASGCQGGRASSGSQLAPVPEARLIHYTAAEPRVTMAGYDLVIRGGTVYDGTGAAGARADVGVRGERIAAVGIIPERGGAELDATGLAGVARLHRRAQPRRLRRAPRSPDGVQGHAGRHDGRRGQLRLRHHALRVGPRAVPALQPGRRPAAMGQLRRLHVEDRRGGAELQRGGADGPRHPAPRRDGARAARPERVGARPDAGLGARGSRCGRRGPVHRPHLRARPLRRHGRDHPPRPRPWRGRGPLRHAHAQ